MSHDEIIAMAREAGLLPDNAHPAPETRAMRQRSEAVQIFAALVAEKAAANEREACAQVCASEEARALYNFDNDVEANRPFWNGGSQIATSCEASIRARSKP